MSHQTPRPLQIIQATNISLLSTGVQTLFTTQNLSGQRFVPVQIYFELITVSGFTVVPTISFGQNGGSFNDILAASPITGVGTANQMLAFNLPLSVITSIANNVAVGINVTVGATSTTYAGNFYILGFYR